MTKWIMRPPAALRCRPGRLLTGWTLVLLTVFHLYRVFRSSTLPVLVRSHHGKINTCLPNNATLPENRIFHPLRFFNKHKTYYSELKRNRNCLVNNYIIFGQRQSEFSVYYHVHKAGGTTLEQINVSVPVAVLNWGTKKKVGQMEFDRQAQLLVKEIQQSRSAVLYTFLRDPAVRFLSGVGQLLSMPYRFHKLKPCQNKPTTQEMLICVLDKIARGRSFLDPHLVPQAFELYSAVQSYDIPVQLFSLNSGLDSFLDICTSSSKRLRLRSQTSDQVSLEHFPQFNLTAHILDGDSNLLHRICKLYRVDVLMLQELEGLVNTECPIVR